MILFKDIQGFWVIKYQKQFYKTYCRNVSKAIMLVYKKNIKPL